MKAARASLIDAYKVHKTVDEFRKDVGLTPLADAEYSSWIVKLLDPKHHYYLLVHSRKVVGMVWGRETDGHFLVEGKFLRRAWRGKFRFSRRLQETYLQMTKGFDTIRAVLPPCAKPKNTQRMIGWLIEEGG